MPHFNYTAVQPDGQRVSGEIQAESREAAVAKLQAQDLRVERLDEAGREPGAGTAAITSADARQAAAQAADVMQAGLPLASGMRALSEDVPSPRLRRVLTTMSQRLEEGASLEEVLGEHSRSIPSHLMSLIRSGIRTNALALMIDEYFTFARRQTELRRRIWLSLGYSIVLILMTCLVLTAILVFVVPEFVEIFRAFDMELPSMTMSIIRLSQLFVSHGWMILAGLVVFLAVVWYGTALLAGRAVRRRLLNSVPLIGPLFQLSSLAQFCHLLAVLVDHRVPLPDALRMAGDGTVDANVAEGSGQLAEQIERGSALFQAAAVQPHFPRALVNLLRWDDRPDALADALSAGADMFEAKAIIQSRAFGFVIEPVVIVFVGGMVSVIVLSMFMPLIKLLNDLS